MEKTWVCVSPRKKWELGESTGARVVNTCARVERESNGSWRWYCVGSLTRGGIEPSREEAMKAAENELGNLPLGRG